MFTGIVPVDMPVSTGIDAADIDASEPLGANIAIEQSLGPPPAIAVELVLVSAPPAPAADAESPRGELGGADEATARPAPDKATTLTPTANQRAALVLFSMKPSFTVAGDLPRDRVTLPASGPFYTTAIWSRSVSKADLVTVLLDIENVGAQIGARGFPVAPGVGIEPTTY